MWSGIEQSFKRHYPNYGGIRFGPAVPATDRGLLVKEIDALGPRSAIHMFAYNSWDGEMPRWAYGTEAYVVKTWHEAVEPHFTVQLRFVGYGPGKHFATFHVYMDKSQTAIDFGYVSYLGPGMTRYRSWPVRVEPPWGL